MIFTAGSITGDIALDNKKTVAAFRETEREAQAFGNRVSGTLDEASKKGESSFKRMLDNIKGQAGKRSAFGESIEFLAGAGVVGGLGVAAEKFAEFGEKIGRLSTEMRAGELSSRDMAAELFREVPVLGGMIKGFDGLRDAITGEAAEMAKDAEYVKASDEAWKKRLATIEETKKMQGEWAAAASSIRDNLKMVKMDEAPESWKNLTKTDIDTSNKLAELRSKYEKDAGLLAPDNTYTGPLLAKEKEYADAKKALDQAAKEVAAAIAEGKRFEDAKFKQAGYGQSNYDPSKDPTVIAAGNAQEDALHKFQNIGTDLMPMRDRASKAKKDFDTNRSDVIATVDAQMQAAKDAVSRQNMLPIKQGMEEFGKIWIDTYKKINEAGETWKESDASGLKKHIDDMKAEATSVFDATRSPQEKLRMQIDEAQKLRDAGYINDDTFNRVQRYGIGMRDQQLPNPHTQGEEIFGRRTVTSADLPQSYQDMATSTKQIVENTADMKQLLAQVVVNLNSSGITAPLVVDPP